MKIGKMLGLDVVVDDNLPRGTIMLRPNRHQIQHLLRRGLTIKDIAKKHCVVAKINQKPNLKGK